jgi:spermidine/putrescine ABC transporter ATP-binding subunit
VSAVELQGVSKHFGHVHAVDEISLTVGPGEFLSLLGPSGCGKTTTLRLIAGFEQLTAGRVLLRGQDISAWPSYRRNIGIVFQNYALFPHMTVYENVAFGLRMRRLPPDQIDARVSKVLSLVHLSGLEHRAPRQLSGGQQQRVALARALVIEPQLLLLDEPLSNLDAKLREEMRVELKQIQQQVGITTIFVTHDQDEALTLSDRIVVMNNGRIVQQGTPADVYERPRHSFVAGFIGQSNLLWGVVVAREDGFTRVRTDAGVPLTAVSDQPLEPGRRVLAVIKQARTRVHRPGQVQLPNAVVATMEFVTYLGSTIEYLCRTDGARLTASLPNDAGAPRFRPGETVLLSWRPEDCLLIAE